MSAEQKSWKEDREMGLDQLEAEGTRRVSTDHQERNGEAEDLQKNGIHRMQEKITVHRTRKIGRRNKHARISSDPFEKNNYPLGFCFLSHVI